MSQITLNDLMSDEGLDLTSVVPSAHPHLVPVSWMHATEQLDPRPHLRQDELVCTLGSMLVRPEASERFAATLKATGVSALGLGLGEIHGAPPQELVEACAELSLPLISVPHATPFLSINEAILRLREELQDAARSMEARVLTELLAAARSGASASSLLAHFIDTMGLESDATRAADTRARGGSIPEALLGTSVSAEAAMQLGSILDFCDIEAERRERDTQQRIGQMFELIERGLAHPAALAGEMAGGANRWTIVQVTAWPSGSEQALRRHRPNAVIGTTSSIVLMVAPPRSESELRELRLACGFSSDVDVSNLRRGLAEARAALRAARTRSGIAGPTDLISFEALLEQTPSDALLRFAEQLYDPLMSSDLERKTELVTTLRNYLENDQQLQRTASRLYVHVNTVRYRLQRIAELTNRDPLTHSGLTDLRIAVWAHDRRRGAGAPPHRAA